MKNQTPLPLDELLERRSVVFYGCGAHTLPTFALQNTDRHVRVFLKNSSSTPGTNIKPYGSLAEVRAQRADVYFVDHEATKVLLARFPETAVYVLVRFMPRISWALALPGLLRRIIKGEVKVVGIRKFAARKGEYTWLVIQNKWVRTTERFTLSAEVGVQGLLDFLRKEDIQYVVERNFEKLPELHRPGGDLDLLVADEDEGALQEFLREHPGHINIGVCTVSRPLSHNNLLCYPPQLAREMLAHAQAGPAGSRVPAPREAFLSLAYHALYHLGTHAGITSTTPGVEVSAFPNNDYTGALTRMSHALGITPRITMEDLDEYLAKAGWRPKLDTLAIFAHRNEWVKERFFARSERAEEVGLGVFVIKEHAFTTGVAEKIVQEIESQAGLQVLRTKKLSKEEQAYMANHIRGGVWADKSGEAAHTFWPAMALVVLDVRTARLAKIRAGHVPPSRGIRALKERLRGQFDTGPVSLLHSTDTTPQAWEYVRVCFEDEAGALQKEVGQIVHEITLSWYERLWLYGVTTWRSFMRRIVLGAHAMRSYIKSQVAK